MAVIVTGQLRITNVLSVHIENGGVVAGVGREDFELVTRKDVASTIRIDKRLLGVDGVEVEARGSREELESLVLTGPRV